MLELLYVGLLGVAVVFSALAAFAKDIMHSVILLSATSLAVAMTFFMLQAPDIAITKAAVESGLVTAIFVVAVHKTVRREEDAPPED